MHGVGHSATSWRRAGARALIVAVALAAPLLAAAPATAAPLWMLKTLPPDMRAALVESLMTTSEKLQLTSGTFVCLGNGGDGYTPGIPRLGIPALNLAGSGQGVSDVCVPMVSRLSTMLPAPIAVAASWDPAAESEAGTLIATESRDFGFNINIGNMVNQLRDPRNGRSFETEGEDPYLAGTLVAAKLRAIEAGHLAAGISMFAANQEQEQRFVQSSDVDERTLHELDLRGFEIAIKSSGVSDVMCGYNQINHVPACDDPELLTGVLRGEWGFQGFVLTDWWACGPPLTWIGSPACPGAAQAGLDMEQPQTSFFGSALQSSLSSGALSMSTLNTMVHRILRSLFASGVVDYPPVKQPINVAAGAATAQDLAERSAVLLKNSGSLLPLNRATAGSIAVIGGPANATDPEPPAPLGGHATDSSAWVNPADIDTPLQGLQDVAPGVPVTYNDGSDLASAAAAAQSAHVAIVYVTDTQGESVDIPNLTLDNNADALISAVVAANPRTIVVLMTGTAATMPWIASVPSVLEAWYPGEQGGHAIAHLLFGDVNPQGRLPLTFPASEADLPDASSAASWPGTKTDVQYSEGLFSGYRWYDAQHITPLFPFGYGLSYGGSFTYSNLGLSAGQVPVPSPVADGHVLAQVGFSTTNTGTALATAVPEVYVGFPAGIGEPPKRLVGWQRLALAPGQTQAASVTLDDRSLAYWNTADGQWEVAPGSYPVCVGNSSADVRLVGTLVVGAPSASTAACPG